MEDEVLKEAFTGDGKIINSDFLNGLEYQSKRKKFKKYY